MAGGRAARTWRKPCELHSRSPPIWNQRVGRRHRQSVSELRTARDQRFLPIHAAVHNTFAVQRHLVPRCILRVFRTDAARAWQIASAAHEPTRSGSHCASPHVPATTPPPARPSFANAADPNELLRSVHRRRDGYGLHTRMSTFAPALQNHEKRRHEQNGEACRGYHAAKHRDADRSARSCPGASRKN